VSNGGVPGAKQTERDVERSGRGLIYSYIYRHLIRGTEKNHTKKTYRGGLRQSGRLANRSKYLGSKMSFKMGFDSIYNSILMWMSNAKERTPRVVKTSVRGFASGIKLCARLSTNSVQESDTIR